MKMLKTRYRVIHYSCDYGTWYVAQFKPWYYGWNRCINNASGLRDTIAEAEEDCRNHRNQFCVKEVTLD